MSSFQVGTFAKDGVTADVFAAHAVAEFSADGSVRILESSGPVEIGSRAPCASGHGPAEECDACRGICLGGMERPPDAVALPERL